MRYRGEQEPIDPVAGRIPGIVNRFFGHNLQRAVGFKPAAELRAEFYMVLGDVPAGDSVFYRGSGVSACHNLLAMAVAGLAPGYLHAGSWSDWISDPSRPTATGSH